LLIDPFNLSIKVEGASTQNDFVRLIGWGIPTAVLLLAAVLFERHHKVDLKRFSFIAYLGDCSYSLYLMHPFALLFITKVWKILHLERFLGWEALGIALIGGSIGLAVFSYRYIEKPLTKWLHQRSVLWH
jgi:peptidoglycan/LPS O-acetylase OafA/YrhL